MTALTIGGDGCGGGPEQMLAITSASVFDPNQSDLGYLAVKELCAISWNMKQAHNSHFNQQFGSPELCAKQGRLCNNVHTEMVSRLIQTIKNGTREGP